MTEFKKIMDIDLRQRNEPGLVKNPKSLLFTPFEIKNVCFANRLMVSPMCMYSCENGVANNFHLVHIGQFAMRGVGLVMMEGTAVSANSRKSPYCLGIWSQEHCDALKPVVEFVHSMRGRVGIQLLHAGRKSSIYPIFDSRFRKKLDIGWPNEVYSSSTVPYDESSNIPRELTELEIKNCILDFVNAAKYALEAGFDVIEIQAAHGYLIHSFLSPLSNTRTDKYGGSLKNRARFLLELIEKVRPICPKPLFVRLSCSDWVDSSSWNIEEAVVVSQLLKDLGVDVIDCSSGGLHPQQKISTGPGYQVPFSAQIKKIGIPTIAVGAITNAKQAEDVLKSESADFIMMGREFLRDSIVFRAAKDLDEDLNLIHQYSTAK